MTFQWYMIPGPSSPLCEGEAFPCCIQMLRSCCQTIRNTLQRISSRLHRALPMQEPSTRQQRPAQQDLAALREHRLAAAPRKTPQKEAPSACQSQCGQPLPLREVGTQLKPSQWRMDVQPLVPSLLGVPSHTPHLCRRGRSQLFGRHLCCSQVASPLGHACEAPQR